MANVNWQAVNAEIKKIKAQLEPLNVNAEKCGNWVWISGNTKQYSHKLRKLGCEFSKEKEMWFYIPRSLPKGKQTDKRHTIDEIRSYHGSEALRKAQASKKGTSSSGSSRSKFSSLESSDADDQFNLTDYLGGIISKLFGVYVVLYGR
jgi:hypothetical protein